MEQCHANADCVGFYWGVEDSNRDTYKDCHLKRTLTYKPKSNRYISAKKYDQLSLAEKTKIDDGNLVICTGLTIGTPINSLDFRLRLELKIAEWLFFFLVLRRCAKTFTVDATEALQTDDNNDVHIMVGDWRKIGVMKGWANDEPMTIVWERDDHTRGQYSLLHFNVTGAITGQWRVSAFIQHDIYIYIYI